MSILATELSSQLQPVLQQYPEIKLAYFFGSKARGEDGPMSDYDFAVYLDSVDKRRMSEIQLELIGKISLVLKTNHIDVVILNTAQKPELKYNIIQEGKIIFEQEPFRVLVEPRILHEYFDFRSFLLRHHLTHS